MMTVCQNIKLRIEKRFLIEWKSYLQYIMTSKRLFFIYLIHYFSVCIQILPYILIFLEIPIKEFYYTLRDIKNKQEYLNDKMFNYSFLVFHNHVAQSCRIILWFCPAFTVRLEMERSPWQLIVYNGYELFSIEKSQITNIINIIQTNPIIMFIHTT